MAQYGTHPTIYADCSNDALFAMFRGESWYQMDETHRQALLQETVNRSAALNGEMGACQVVFADGMDPCTSGEQCGDVIRLNRDHFVFDITYTEYNGRSISTFLEYSNMLALETALHEDIHAWQNQCLDGTIQCPNPDLLKEYAANNFDLSLVEKADGTTAMGSQYLSGCGSGGYYLYYLQSTERDAHLYSQLRTQQIVEQLTQKYGSEESFSLYLQNVQENGFDAVAAMAEKYFGTESVERDINTTLMNQFYGTNEPVLSPAVENAVKNDMILSLQQSLTAGADPTLQTPITPTPDDPTPKGAPERSSSIDNTLDM